MNAILGLKKEMTQIFDKNGKVLPVTLVDVKGCRVVGKREKEYNAVKLGFGVRRNANMPEAGKYKETEIPRFVKEFKIEVDSKVGDAVNPDVFELGDKVWVTAISKGKGFAGVVKRWGFHGNGNRTHGQSNTQRHAGSIGAGTTPGRVYKGRKMAGRDGGKTVTMKNMEVLFIDVAQGLIGIKGALPGSKNSLITIVKK